MNRSFIPFYETLGLMRTYFVRRVGIRGMVHSLQILAMALAISAVHTFLLPADAWGMGLLALASANLSVQLYAAKSKLAGKALMLQFLVGSAVGLVACVIFPSQWYFCIIGIFAAYAIWNKLRPGKLGSLAAVIVNVLFFDVMMPQPADAQIQAVLGATAGIVAEAAFGVAMALLVSLIVNSRPTDELSRIMRSIKKNYAALFMKAVAGKRIRAGIAEAQASNATMAAMEGVRVQKIGAEESDMAQKLAGLANVAFYHLIVFSRIRMDFTQPVKDAILKSPYFHNDIIEQKTVEEEQQTAGLCRMHVEKFIAAYGMLVRLLDEWEERGYAKRRKARISKDR